MSAMDDLEKLFRRLDVEPYFHGAGCGFARRELKKARARIEALEKVVDAARKFKDMCCRLDCNCRICDALSTLDSGGDK